MDGETLLAAATELEEEEEEEEEESPKPVVSIGSLVAYLQVFQRSETWDTEMQQVGW